MVKLTLRIEFDSERAIGPGKARLLELIERHRSIAAAGRAMGVSYRRAWLLVDELNRCFDEPIVQAQYGGRAGGGAALTEIRPHPGRALSGHRGGGCGGHAQAPGRAAAPAAPCSPRREELSPRPS